MTALIEHNNTSKVPVKAKPRRATAVTAQARPALTPMEMISRALDMGVSADILKQMMDLRDREEARNARLAFTRAVAAAKAELRPIMKNREVDYTPTGKARVNYRHEDLAGIEEQISETLTKHGLSYRYELDNGPDRPITVACILEHVDGHFTRTPLTATADTSGNKNNLQGIASTVTYLERYTLKAALGLSVSHDDDGIKGGQDEAASTVIDGKQLDKLRKLIEQTNSDTEKFCNYYKIDALPDLPAALFDRAVTTLNAKGARS